MFPKCRPRSKLHCSPVQFLFIFPETLTHRPSLFPKLFYCCSHIVVCRMPSGLKEGAVSSPRILFIYQSIRHHNPEFSEINVLRHEHLKSHFPLLVYLTVIFEPRRRDCQCVWYNVGIIADSWQVMNEIYLTRTEDIISLFCCTHGKPHRIFG